MSLFGKKKEPQITGLIGVDIGASGVKLVELATESGRARLLNYAYSELKDPGASQNSLVDDPKAASAVLTRLLKEANIKSRRANASLPSYSVFHTIVTIAQPSNVKEDLKPLIEAQVKKLLPMPIEDMILDSTVIDKNLLPKPDEKSEKSLEKKHLRVLVSGAPKALIQKYVETFKLAKLDLISLETEAFALIRSLVGKDKSRIMIVDVGFERSNITIVSEGVPFLHRSIKAGGAMVTQMIAKQTGTSLSEAEQTKRDLTSMSADEEIPPALREAMMPIKHEVKYSLELYGGQQFHDYSTVEKIIITGGSAHLPQIDKFLSQEININTYIGDPWARVMTPDGLRPVLDEIGPRFAVAIGLAMKDVEKK